MEIPILLIVTLGIFVSIKVMMSFGNKKYKNNDDYLDKEYEANLIRKKDFNKDFLISPKLEELPLNDNLDKSSKLYKLEENVKASANNKMIRLDKNYTNTELKHLFGFNHIETVFKYEDNYNNFIVNLNKWAKKLIEANNLNDAKTVLEYALAIGSKHTQTYKMLIQIYKNNKDNEKFQSILNIILNEDIISESEKDILLNYITELDNI